MSAATISIVALHLVVLPNLGQTKPLDWFITNPDTDASDVADRCTIPIIDASIFSEPGFDDKRFSQGPVLVRGLTKAQAAHEHWDRAAFKAAFGELYGMKTVPLYSAQFPHSSSQMSKQSVTLQRYLNDITASYKEKKHPPSHMFERSQSGLAAQAFSLHGVPDAMSSLSQQNNNTVSVLSLGAHRQGLSLHQHSWAWLSLMRGRKLWFFMAPDALQNHEAYESLALKLPNEWSNRLVADRNMQVCEQLPGDVVYVPALWHHATQNHGDVLGVGMQSSDMDDVALQRYPHSAFVKDFIARNTLVDLEAQKPSNWRKKSSNALRTIENAIELEPLDFGRRCNAVLARARVAKLEGKNSTDIVLTLFKEWSKVERFANETYTRGVLSPAHFTAVMASLVQSIQKSVPQQLQHVGKDVVEYLTKTGRDVDPSTFESFEARE